LPKSADGRLLNYNRRSHVRTSDERDNGTIAMHEHFTDGGIHIRRQRKNKTTTSFQKVVDQTHRPTKAENDKLTIRCHRNTHGRKNT
jgi:hypothetical protein